jgi:hypothetical protein
MENFDHCFVDNIKGRSTVLYIYIYIYIYNLWIKPDDDVVKIKADNIKGRYTGQFRHRFGIQPSVSSSFLLTLAHVLSIKTNTLPKCKKV